MDVDEATLLKAYGLETLEPTRWHDTREAHPGAEEDEAASLLFDGEQDPLNLRPKMPSSKDFDPGLRAHLSLSSKSFDPKLFLSQVHPEATFADLSRGVIYLKESIDQRSEALKVLVQDNFDRFVAVKATNDGVFREMKDPQRGPLRPGAEYGTKEVRAILAQASAKADQAFMPVLENNLKAGKLRSSLGVFERSKFFFNLPAALGESIDRGRYDVALRDYRKGKYLLQSRPGQLLALPSTADGLGLAGAGDASMGGSSNTIDAEGNVHNSKLQAQQKRVFDKVWSAVQRVMQDMEQRLFAQLKEPGRTVDDQMRTIEILLELQPSQDPVSTCLEAQRAHARNLVTRAYDSCVAKIDIARASPMQTPEEETRERVKDLRACLREIRRSDTRFDDMAGGATWKEIAAFVRKMCDAMLQTLPSFWRIAKHYADGKLVKKGNPTTNVNERVVSQCRAWAADSVEEFISLVSHFFSLTDVAILVRKPLSPLPDWVPLPTSFSTAASFMRAMLDDLAEVIAEIDALNIGNANQGLHSLLENMRFSFTEVLCNLWVADTQTLLKLEDWTLDPIEPSTTLFLNDLSLFHKSNARLAYLVAGGRDLLAGTARTKSAMVQPDFVARIKATFTAVLRATLEGMADLAISDFDPTYSDVPMPRRAAEGSMLTIDVTGLDVRVLLSITNIAHMNTVLLPSMLKQFSEAFSTTIKEETKAFKDQCTRIDVALFEGYIQRKSKVVCGILSKGILDGGVDWSGLPKPSEVHPFIYEALLAVVQVHAQVRAVAKQLVDRSISAILERIASETLRDFRQVNTFGMGGMLQATLEIEFIHQTLSQFVSPAAERTLKEVYETISERYERKSPDEAELLKNELEVVKKTLVASRKATALQFLCFRRTRTKEKEEPAKAA